MDDLKRYLCSLEVDARSHAPRQLEKDGKYVDEGEGELQQDATSKAVVSKYEDTLRLLGKEIEQLKEQGELQSRVREVIPQVVLSLLAHVGNHYWTSLTSRQLAKGVLAKVINLCGCTSISELLTGHLGSHDSHTHPQDSTSPYLLMAENTAKTIAISHEVAESSSGLDPATTADTSDDSAVKGKEVELLFSRGIIKSLLSLLRTKLTRDSWKKQPSAKHAFIWTLKQLKHPHLSPHLPSLLPPLLMLLDDHESYHKVLGLTAVAHLIKNVDPSELRWYGRAEVIYEAVRTMLYIREVTVINSLHNCLLLLLPVLEGPQPLTSTAPRKATKTDDVFRILLNNLDFESKIPLRKAYITHVSNYVELLGIYTARHMKQLLKVLEECLKYPDYSGEETRLSALKSLLAVMKHTWPRVPCHRDKILQLLLKLVSDLCPDGDHVPDTPEIRGQLKLISVCMLTLHHCCGTMEDVYRLLERDCTHRGLRLCLESSLTEMEQGQL